MNIKYRLFTIALVLIGGSMLTACNFKREKSNSAEDIDQSELDSAVSQGLSFELLSARVFRPYCQECHNPTNLKGDLNVLSYENVLKNRDTIRLRVLESADMPPADRVRPSSTNLEILRLWIAAGAPFDETTPPLPTPTPDPTPDPTPTPTPPPLEPSFSSIKINIFEPKCSKCHNSDPTSDGDIFQSQEDMILDKLIISGLPEDSKLIKWVSPRPNGVSPKMPPKNNNFGISPLTADQIDVLKAWIKSL
jgi:hypothetical protein